MYIYRPVNIYVYIYVYMSMYIFMCTYVMHIFYNNNNRYDIRYKASIALTCGEPLQGCCVFTTPFGSSVHTGELHFPVSLVTRCCHVTAF